MLQRLVDPQKYQVGSQEDWLFIQPRSVRHEIGDPFHARTFGQRPQVNLAEDERRQCIRQNGLDGLELRRIAEERVDGRVGGAQPGVILGNSQDDDGYAAEEEEDGTETGRTEGEP
jgi:hypothetical protein